MTSLPGQIDRIQATSFQFSAGSNWPAIHWPSDFTPVMPFTKPSRLPKLLRLPRSTLSAQSGLVAISKRLASVIRGGTVMPFLMSRWRWPCTCRSTVSTSALHFAAIARSTSDWAKPRSFMT